MVEIEFSVMENNPDSVNRLRSLLQVFETQNHIRVRLVAVPWSQGWAEIAKSGIYEHGPDVSEVGTTWIGSLAAMNALRPFTSREVQALGGTGAYFESLWHTGFLPNDPTPWAIPLTGDLLVLYYLKDALEKAGISDPRTAFSSHSVMLETLKKLQKIGYLYPLALTTTNQTRNLHEAAGWIWNAGGDILSPDYKRVIFHEDAALQGLKNFFSLQPFIPPESLNVMPASQDLFHSGKSVVLISGVYPGIVDRQQYLEMTKCTGIAPTREATYIGGSSLVIWQYSRHAQEAFELVRFIASQPGRIPDSPSFELPTGEILPKPSIMQDPFYHNYRTRQDWLGPIQPSGAQDQFYPAYLQALQTGHAFPTVRLWGLVEEKLNRAIANIWEELFANPAQDIDACLHKHLDPIAERLNTALGS